MRQRPLLYLDVDGPLNPYAAKPHRRPEGYTTHRMKPEGWIARHPGEPRNRVKPLRVWLNPEHGPRLLALAELYDLVWATTWVAEANVFIAPVIGLPELPVVEWPMSTGTPPDDPPSDGTFWKTRHLVAHATGRPFAWIDDELGGADRAFVAAHHDRPALLHHVDARLGLRDTDFTALTAFAHQLRTAAA
ncbi:HAD domain-containing protein [Streptomyces sp. NPDC050658]|uniref:HAD domain-containing protein n=1 Tax=unclassified Streptomyces TaxID=2593676 RepID=UPI00342EDAB1